LGLNGSRLLDKGHYAASNANRGDLLLLLTAIAAAAAAATVLSGKRSRIIL